MVKWQRQPYARLRQGQDDYGYEEIRVFNPSRGLNLLVADMLVNDKEATAGTKNIEYVEGGAARKRMGYAPLSNTGLNNPGKGIGQYTSETANYIITSDGGILKRFQSNTWTSLSGSVTMDASADITFTPLFQRTYAWDGVSGGVVWDGTTLTRPGTMPRAKFSVIYKGYHVSSGVDGQPFRLYFAPSGEPSRFTRSAAPTDPNDVALNDATNVPGATVFTGDNSPRAIDINKNDGQKVTGLGFFQDVLIVFKEQSIYQLYFNSDNGFVVERISSSYGAVCHGAIASVENDCYFLTEQGVYVLGNEPNYYAAIRTNELSSRIKNLLEMITPAQYRKVQAVYWRDRYFLSIPLNNSTVNSIVVYDRRFYAWMLWDNIYANDMLIFKDKDNDGKTHFYFSDDRVNKIQEFTPNAYSDDGAAINAIFRTRSFEGKALEKEKFWYVIRPVFRLTTGDVQISYITEHGTEGVPVSVSGAITGGLAVDQIGALTFGTSQHDTYTGADMGIGSLPDDNDSSGSSETDSSHTVFDLGVNLDSRTLKVQFQNNGLNETFTLLGFIILYQTKDFRRFDGAYTIR